MSGRKHNFKVSSQAFEGLSFGYPSISGHWPVSRAPRFATWWPRRSGWRASGA
jgi:hypothetical protein